MRPTPAPHTCTAYWVQGVLSLSDLASKYYYKDLLHASPATLQVATSIAYLPWTLKPLYGFCSDTIPLLGRQRKSYLALAALIATACFALLALLPASSAGWLVLSTTLAAAIALSDVVVDGLVVERSRNQPQVRLQPKNPALALRWHFFFSSFFLHLRHCATWDTCTSLRRRLLAGCSLCVGARDTRGPSSRRGLVGRLWRFMAPVQRLLCLRCFL